MSEDILGILDTILDHPQIGVGRAGIFVATPGRMYALKPFLQVIREHRAHEVTDTAWHLLRGLQDALPRSLRQQPQACGYTTVRDDAQRLTATISDLQSRLVARIALVSAWDAGTRTLERELRIIGEAPNFSYGYWPNIAGANGKNALLQYDSIEEAMTANIDAATYRVIDAPRIIWRTNKDAHKVLSQKWTMLHDIAQAHGAYPYLFPQRFAN